jgi:CRISPR/Cas system CMR subunit Cmr6 (Cas7 group RAMP superfamily)
MMVAAIHHGECKSQAEPEREDERLHPVRFGVIKATVTSALSQSRQSEFHATR